VENVVKIEGEKNKMVDPNQSKRFTSDKTRKNYPHRNRHVANERQVDLDLFKKSFEERKERKMIGDEFEVFNTAYGLGYKEGRNRHKQLIKKNGN